MGTLNTDNLSRADSADVLNNPGRWTPNVPRPGFDAVIYQSEIDAILGRSRGKSILKLVWMPEVFKWRPHALHESPRGYDLPTYLALWDSRGREVAAPRWAIMQLEEPEYYRGGWSRNRYLHVKNLLHDVKGPCPDERYTPLWRVLEHDTHCCELLGDEVCWGYYAEPGDNWLALIRKQWAENKEDRDVQPYARPVEIETPNAQREVRDDLAAQERLRYETIMSILEEADQRRMKQAVYSLPADGFTRRESGLFLMED